MTNGKTSYCRDCRSAAERDHTARKNARRRHAIAGPRYTLAGIGDRDGWRCHLCNERVDQSLSGNDPMGPTRDHLVPISAGGWDGPDNVRLAHRLCNVRRGAGGLVQLLVA